jgi:hypothetical protein
MSPLNLANVVNASAGKDQAQLLESPHEEARLKLFSGVRGRVILRR